MLHPLKISLRWVAVAVILAFTTTGSDARPAVSRVGPITNALTPANAWHIPDNSTDVGGGLHMRNPEFEFDQSTAVTFYTGVQKYNNSFGTANQTGGTLYVRKVGATAWIPVTLGFHVNSGNNQFWKASYTFSNANGYGPNDVIQYYFALSFDATGGGSATVGTTYLYGGKGDQDGGPGAGTTGTESVAQAKPYTLRNRPAFVFHSNNRVVNGTNVLFTTEAGYIGKDGSAASQWANRGALYYTTDGSTPVGSLGAAGNANTTVIPLALDHTGNNNSVAGNSMFWAGTVANLPMYTTIQYKIGMWHTDNGEEKFADYSASSAAGTNFSFSIGVVNAPALTVNGVAANYTTTHVFVNEIAGEQVPLTILFDPGTAAADPATVQVYTNLNRRDQVSLPYVDASGITTEEGIQPPSGDVIGTNDAHYFKAYTMAAATGGATGYQLTMPAAKTGVYRLTARYKLASTTSPNPNPWVYYTSGGRRDHAVVVSPNQSRDIQLYELNTLNIDATGDQPSQRSTFPDLADNSKRWNLNYLKNLGCNWLWFQPIHPNGIDGRQLDPDNSNAPYNVGSPYAVKNFFEIMPLMGKGFNATTTPALNDPNPVPPTDASYANSPRGKAKADFANFVASADQQNVGIMLDAPFNHTSYDSELGANGVNYFAPASAYTTEIRNAKARFYSQSGNYAGRASSSTNIAVAPDRGDFGKFGDTFDVYFGTYSALVDTNPNDNGNYLNEGDQFFGYLGSSPYPNGDPYWNSVDFSLGGVGNNITRNVWRYFANYVPYWLGQTGHGDANGNPYRNSTNPDATKRLYEDSLGIDGLRADFGQGLPPQAWEYMINVARSYKWNFVFMTESLDGGAVTYRSNRHFDILNENIVFPFQSASTAQDYRNIFDGRRAAYGQSLVLMNSTSHDEANYADPFQALIRYLVAGTENGVPMIFYGQENGISANFGFDHFETNFGKQIPHFKRFNSLGPILGNQNYALQQLYPVFAAVGQARQFSPALRSSNRYYLNQTDGSQQTKIFSVAKYQTANAAPGVSDVVFGFVNLDRNVQNGVDQGNNQVGNFNVNITQNGSNLFGIQRGRSYNVRNVAAYTAIDNTRRSTFLIPGNITGDTLLDGGLYVALKKVPGADADWASAPFEAQYLKLYDVTPPPTDTAPVAPKGYALGNSVTLSWAAVSDPLGGVSGYRVVISTNPDGSNPIVDTWLTGNVTSATFNGVTPGQTLYARVAAVNNAGIAAPLSAASAGVPVLDPNADADGDGATNAAEDVAGTNPFNAASIFRVLNIVPAAAGSAANTRVITWSSVPGKNYVVEFSPTLAAGSFTALSTAITATGASTSYNDQSSATKNFYRVRVYP